MVLVTIDYISKTFQRSASGNVPMYLQISNYFNMQNKAGILATGEKLPAEEDLCKVFGVSRTTIRQAINQLVEQGLFVRYRAKGTFVSEQKLTRKLNHLYNFSSDMRALGITPSSVTLCQETMDAKDTQIMKQLALPDELSRVFHLERVRYANDRPVLLEDTYIPLYLCPGIEEYDFNKMSLYEVLKTKYNLTPYNASETLQAIMIPAKEQKTLKCHKNTIGYRINRVGYLNSNCIYEYTTSLTRADICLYQFELNNVSASNLVSAIIVQDNPSENA